MDNVKLHVEGEHIAVLTISREEVLNALNRKVLQEIDQALDVIDLEMIRCLVITGVGDKAFIAGADIKMMAEMDKNDAIELSNFNHNVLNKIAALPIPTIAAINGFSLGGGAMNLPSAVISE